MPSNTIAGRDSGLLRIGIVGAGKMARHHATAVGRTRTARLVAFVDSDPRARSEATALFADAVAYASLAELLATKSTDVIHICTPPASHATLTAEVLRSGQHVYVEKPFAPSGTETSDLLRLAARNKLKVCAGHQLLFEKPCRDATELFQSIGKVSHLESYFSFRTVRRSPGGRLPLRSDLQLLDILPHPIYLLLHFLQLAQPGESTHMTALNVGEAGTVHALIRCGSLTGNLTVSLQARPIESCVRASGSNGALTADFVRGTVQRLIGPGTSGIDKILAPYRVAMQLLLGTTRAVVSRLRNRQKSYPGLVEAFEAFYAAIANDTPSPTSPESIEDTVRIWEEIAEQLERVALPQYDAPEPAASPGSRLVVSGGTGFLGRELCKEGLKQDLQVTALARREPAAWERIAGVEYRVVDLGTAIPDGVLPNADSLIHAAAETAGGWDEHQRNSLDATVNILEAAARAGIADIIHVSSVAVLGSPSGRPVRDDDELKTDSRSFGPYVWGKLESERLARQTAERLGLRVRVVRPGPIVDFREFDPPGRLGKRIGGLFVAAGTPGQRLAVVDVQFAATLLVWMGFHLDDLPAAVNLLNPESPTKRYLVERLRGDNPGLRIVWLPGFLLKPLSWLAMGLQKVLRPGRPAINLARIFAVQAYDTATISALTQERERLSTEEQVVVS